MASPHWTDALGTSDVFLSFQDHLALLADCDRPILVIGERGTGKELAVQRLHYMSSRWEKPLVTVLCPAISPGLLESELFGHEAGAFTGARGRRQGYFERADGGSIFLDEVADMPLPLQDKLLRVLEYGVFERVGGSVSLEVDVRVLAATNRNLPALAREGKFREDLLDRLSFDVLQVPPLRVRGEDKLLLARHFASRMLLQMHKREEDAAPPVFGEKALNQLENYAWPGNIRELKNAVERSVLRAGTAFIEELALNPFAPLYGEAPQAIPGEDLAPENRAQAGCGAEPSDAAQNHGPAASAASTQPNALKPALPGDSTQEQNPEAPLPPNYQLSAAVAELEKASLHKALHQAHYRQKDAAALLGLSYNQFRALYRKYGGPKVMGRA